MNSEGKAEIRESLDNDDDALFEENIIKNKRVSEVSITEFNEVRYLVFSSCIYILSIYFYLS